MVLRTFAMFGIVALVLTLGCKPGADSPAPAPITPAFPTAAPADPQAMFDQWKDLVTHPEKIGGGVKHGQLAWELTEREPKYADKMIDMLVDPATTPESRFLILNSIEVARIPSTYPRLLDLTKPEVDPGLRTAVVIMFKNISDPTVDARLRELTNDPERRVRLAALLVLSGRGDTEMRSALHEYYFTDGLPPEHRSQIVQSLALTPGPGDVKVLGAAVNDATLAEGPRLLSIATLAQIGEPTAIPQLQQCADADNSPTLKEAAANAIKALTGKLGAGAASAPPSGP